MILYNYHFKHENDRVGSETLVGNVSIMYQLIFFYQLLGQVPSQCLLPPHEGPCRAAYHRWYYNKEKGKCMVFVYGGCEGNANNFYTKPACKIVCMQRNRSKVILMYMAITTMQNSLYLFLAKNLEDKTCIILNKQHEFLLWDRPLKNETWM